MNQAFWTVLCFVGLLALVPLGVKWLAKQRAGALGTTGLEASHIVSVLAVGQQQRVVTVEVGPADARTWLVLGVTPQAIQTLHSIPRPRAEARAPATPFAQELVLNQDPKVHPAA